MLEVIRIILGALVLLLGIPLGIILARSTKGELEKRQKFFKIIIFTSLIAGFVSLIIQNDTLMFSFFFIAIVTAQSLKKQKF